jgi:hypothetical protein
LICAASGRSTFLEVRRAQITRTPTLADEARQQSRRVRRNWLGQAARCTPQRTATSWNHIPSSPSGSPCQKARATVAKTITKMAPCATCGRMTQHIHTQPSHVLQFLMLFVTFGLWFYVERHAPQCAVCGRLEERQERRPSPASVPGKAPPKLGSRARIAVWGTLALVFVMAFVLSEYCY